MSSLPSLSSILRKPQSHPQSPSPLASPLLQPPQSKECSQAPEPEPSQPPSPSPLASPPPQPPRNKRCRQEQECEPSQASQLSRKARRNAKSKYARCKVCGSNQHQEGRLWPVPHCSHCFSQDHGSFDCKEPRAEGKPSLITGRS